MPQLYKAATVAPGRIPANQIIFADPDQYHDLFTGNYEFDLVNGYGCDPTGVTECSAAVNQAFTDAAASGKSAAVVGYGTLLVNQTVKCSSDNIALIGRGAGHPDHMLNGLRFKAASSFTGTRIVDFSTTSKPLSGVLMQNVCVDGNNHSGTGLDGIYFSAHDSLMDFCHVAYCTGWGIRVAGVNATNAPPSGWTCYNTLVRGCRVRACDAGGILWDDFSTDTHDQECWVFYCGLTDVAGSTVRNANADGMVWKSSGHQSSGYHAYSNTGHGANIQPISASQITGAYLENNGKAGLFFDNATAGASGFRCTNSYIWANSTTTNAAFSNVHVGSSGGFGLSAIVADNHIVGGSNTNKPNYAIDMPSSVCQNWSVHDNITGNTYVSSPAIHAFGSGNAGAACFVHDNQGFNPVGKEASPPGIPAGTGSGNATIPNNYPKTVTYTVYIKAGATAITDIAIAGNLTGMGIPINGSGTIRVQPGQSIYFLGAVPASWTWFGD